MRNTRRILTVLFICLVATATLLVSGCTEAVNDVENTNDKEMVSEAISIEDIGETKWQWSGLIESEPASQSVVPDPENYTILFSKDGTYSVKADCNLGSGSYALEGNEMTLGPGPMTLAACGPESLYDMYVALLGNVNSVTMEDGNLILYSGENNDKMIFTASSEE